jgi:hypothetical protein
MVDVRINDFARLKKTIFQPYFLIHPSAKKYAKIRLLNAP